jgi:predicted permease
MFDRLRQDILYAFRQLRVRPGLSIAAVLTLALGIGANGAIFSVVNGVLLRPLPYGDPDELTAVWHQEGPGGDLVSVSYENFQDWRAETETFADMAAFSRSTVTLLTDDVAERLPGAMITPNTFRLLRIPPALGRDFVADDAIDGATPVVMLSHGLFMGAFGGDAGMIGSTLRLSGVEHQVIGVMPAGFRTPFFEEAELWRPMGDDAACGRGCWFARVVGRLEPGTSLEEAQAELDVVGERLQTEYPDANADVRVAAVGLRDEIVGDVRPALLVILVGVGLVLLIACVNVANLLLARAIAREREVAVRAALGASRGRITKQLLTESVVLALVGGLAGVYVAYMAVDALIVLAPQDLPRLDVVRVDGLVLAAMTVLTTGTGVLFGLVPAFHASRADAGGALGSDRSVAGRQSRGRLRDALVVSQMALAVTLLVGAGLLLKSFVTLVRVDPGFDPRGLLTAETRFSGERYSGPARLDFYEELFTRMEARPDVDAAAGVWLLPFTTGAVISSIEVEGRPDVAPTEEPEASMRPVTDGYFELMRIPLVAGRRLQRSDDTNTQRVVVISESMARDIWADEDPIGRQIRFGMQFEDSEPWREVVGVVGDVKLRGLDDEDRAIAYVPYRQFTIGSLAVALRTAGDPAELAAPFRATVRSIDPQVAVYDVSTMDRLVAASLAERRFFMLLLGLFAALAAILASVGIYAVTSYVVGSRTREMGIRIAVGAQAGEVQRGVLTRAGSVAALGLAIGLAAAFGLTRLMRSLLFETSHVDPLVFSGMAALLAGVALLAAWLPARRASRVDPMIALRQE